MERSDLCGVPFMTRCVVLIHRNIAAVYPNGQAYFMTGSSN